MLPKGTAVYIPVFALHYDSQYYPDPDKFDPERFNEENNQTRPNYPHLPFGEGPRMCTGKYKHIRGVSITFGNWYHHLYSSWSSAMQRQMIVLTHIESQRTSFQADSDFLRPFLWSRVSGLIRFRDGSGFVRISERVRQRLWKWICKRSGNLTLALSPTRKVKTQRDRKKRDRWRAKSMLNIFLDIEGDC
jgi:hypothetical protein